MTPAFRRVALVLALVAAAGACSTSGGSGHPDGSTRNGGGRADGARDTGHETLGDAGDCFAGHVTNGGACSSDEDCCAVVTEGPVECVVAPHATTGTCRAGAGGACTDSSMCATKVCDDGECASAEAGEPCGSGIDCSGLGATCVAGTCRLPVVDAGVVTRDGSTGARDAGSADASRGDAAGEAGEVPDASEGGARDARMSDAGAG